MANYANQKRIDLENVQNIFHHKDEKTEGYYPPMEYEYIDKAAELLNGNAFKLWLYLIRWHNQGYVYFSPAAIDNCMGMKKSSVSDARKELEREGFIYPHPTIAGRYVFSPVSKTRV